MAIIETHPVQYHAPVYRQIQRRFGIPVHAIYGSDFSVAGYHDTEFGRTFAWDTDLLSGYTPVFLSCVSAGGAQSPEAVSSYGLAQTLHRINPVAIMLVGYSPRFYRDALWHAWRSGRGLLFRGETTDHARRRGPVKRWLRDRFLRWLYDQCAVLLYVGQRSREHYQRLGVDDRRLLFSPYCVDTSAFQPDEDDRDRLREPAREELGLSGGDLAILFSGKLVERKAPDLILHAVRELPLEECRRAVAVFLGDGPLRERLQVLAQSSPVRVRFVGFQNQRMLSRFYHAADVLVLPSALAETWGLVINEALCHGLPCVVSSQVGCAPDLIEAGMTGEIFEVGRSDELGAALARAAHLVGRKEVRDQCRRMVAAYSVERAAEGIVSGYGLVAGETR